ncbi:hypothetical protein C8R44DRAFT_862257 [Mycena epipterygia]|nr:hypothetical protein C8R44DRAFT_862257 [Mycena epipterygia]
MRGYKERRMSDSTLRKISQLTSMPKKKLSPHRSRIRMPVDGPISSPSYHPLRVILMETDVDGPAYFVRERRKDQDVEPRGGRQRSSLGVHRAKIVHIFDEKPSTNFACDLAGLRGLLRKSSERSRTSLSQLLFDGTVKYPQENQVELPAPSIDFAYDEDLILKQLARNYYSEGDCRDSRMWPHQFSRSNALLSEIGILKVKWVERTFKDIARWVEVDAPMDIWWKEMGADWVKIWLKIPHAPFFSGEPDSKSFASLAIRSADTGHTSACVLL